MNIEHFKDGKSLGIITPDTPFNRNLTIEFEYLRSIHYGILPKKMTFKVIHGKEQETKEEPCTQRGSYRTSSISNLIVIDT
jgi:hypothetical protein